MAVTLNQMAEAYIESVRAQLQQAQEQAAQAQSIVDQISGHLAECLSQVEQPEAEAEAEATASATDTTTTTETQTIPVNPFQSVSQ